MDVTKVIEPLDSLTPKQLNIMGCTLSYAHLSNSKDPYALTKKNKLIDNNWHRSDFVQYINMLDERYKNFPEERISITDILYSILLISTALKLTRYSEEFISKNNCPK